MKIAKAKKKNAFKTIDNKSKPKNNKTVVKVDSTLAGNGTLDYDESLTEEIVKFFR